MSEKSTKYLRTGLIITIVLLAFVASYRLAVAATAPKAPAFRTACNMKSPGSASGGCQMRGRTPGAAGAPVGGCCGGGSSATVEGTATVDSGVQRVTVDTTTGSYAPNVITLAAGVPAEITFTQATGCLGQVQSADLGFFEDLTSGPKTVYVPAEKLAPGTYKFSCGMQMVFGTIIVR